MALDVVINAAEISLGKCRVEQIFLSAVNLGHTSFLGVLRDAELKSSVCMPSSKMATNASKSNNGRHRRTEMYISFGLSKAETRMKCAFACFYILVQARARAHLPIE